MRIWRWMIPMVWLQSHAIAGIVWQPVMDYSLAFPRERPESPPTINPFENFTHLGTDFGWMGPGQHRIQSRAGVIRIQPDGAWTGLWHSLAGLAIEETRTLDPNDLVGLGGAKEFLAPVRAVTIDVQGKGEIRLELSDVTRRTVWSRQLTLTPGERTRQRFEIQRASSEM